MSLLFIDANIYLEFYASQNIAALIRPLTEIRNNIFVTDQIRREVERNKLRCVQDHLKNNLKLQSTIGCPLHLLPDELSVGLADQIKVVNEKTSQLNGKIAGALKKFLDQVSRSEDHVSQSLLPFFKSALKPSNEQIERARHRRERGDPPGKQSDPLGDQLNWEQLLDGVSSCKGLWIVTRDADIVSCYEKTIRLNPFLAEELQARQPGIEVRCFGKISAGLEDFTKSNNLKPSGLPSKNGFAKIETEEEALRGRESSADLPALLNQFSKTADPDWRDFILRVFFASQKREDVHADK